jgi:uncharacterized repeat protein (TIGR03803 family)
MKNHCQKALIWVALLALVSTNLCAQKLTVLHNFACVASDGKVPIGRLTLSGNKLYGTTSGGDTNGIIFSINTDGSDYTILHAFGPSDGYYSWYYNGTNVYYNWDGEAPNGGLQLSGNTLYGVTENGGIPNNWGTLFSINTDGTGFNVVHNFAVADGSVDGGSDNNPWSDLLWSGDTLYGTTVNGVVYSVNTNGTDFSLLARTGENDGAGENDYGLILSGNTLYGVTELGGTNGLGSLYSCDASEGGHQDLHDFGPNDQTGNSPGGAEPATRLLLVGDMLYGTTQTGGTNGSGALFSLNTNGSSFVILHDFDSVNQNNGENMDGSGPGWGLLLAGDTLYGVCGYGGRYGGGTIFSINTNGTGFTVLYNFGGNSPAGSTPWGGLVLAGCTFYGTTTGSICPGGAGGSAGTVYSFAIVPGITSYSMAGTDLVLNATNGVANCSYTVLTSTNLGLPLSQWTPLATNVLTEAGNFAFSLTNAVDLGASQEFYTLQAQ